MTIAMWPDGLPRPERNSYQMTPQEARLKRQGDAGPPGYRRRFSSVAKTVALSVVVDRTGRSIFDDFYERITGYGSLMFYMPDPTTDGWSLLTSDGLPLLTGDGEPILLAGRWLCLFGDQLPAETIMGVEFRKTFSVTVMP